MPVPIGNAARGKDQDSLLILRRLYTVCCFILLRGPRQRLVDSSHASVCLRCRLFWSGIKHVYGPMREALISSNERNIVPKSVAVSNSKKVTTGDRFAIR